MKGPQHIMVGEYLNEERKKTARIRNRCQPLKQTSHKAIREFSKGDLNEQAEPVDYSHR